MNPLLWSCSVFTVIISSQIQNCKYKYNLKQSPCFFSVVYYLCPVSKSRDFFSFLNLSPNAAYICSLITCSINTILFLLEIFKKVKNRAYLCAPVKHLCTHPQSWTAEICEIYDLVGKLLTPLLLSMLKYHINIQDNCTMKKLLNHIKC